MTPGGMTPGGPGAMRPGGPGGTGSPDGGPGGFQPGGFAGGGQITPNPNQPPKPNEVTDPAKFYPLNEEYLLVRFVDPTVMPGVTYQYRLKIKLKNPNFGQPANTVSQASYVKKEILESGWYVVPGQIPIPPEAYVFGMDPVEYEKTVKEKYPKDNAMQALLKVDDRRQAVVQVHRWMPEVRLADSTKKEPVGAWVIGEMQASPGEFIGRKTLVQLPTWSAEKGYYTLKELPEGLKLKNSTSKDPPKGWLVDLSTDNILVDFDGGRFRGPIGEKTVTDESAEELLILKPDGTMTVRNSEYDRYFKPRDLRAKAWDAWVRQSELMTPNANQNNQPGGPGRPGSGGPGGAGGSGGSGE
jgi:hypothetical protein